MAEDRKYTILIQWKYLLGRSLIFSAKSILGYLGVSGKRAGSFLGS
jgi:hypothetical protein